MRSKLILEIHNFYGEHVGYIERNLYTKPKSIQKMFGYCGVHFPYKSTMSISLVLVEDVPSAERLAEYIPTAALNGAQVTKEQVSYLLSCGVTRLCICLDDDATNKAIRIRRELSLMFDTYVVKCSPDPKDMTHAELDSLVNKILSLYGET